MICDLDNVPLCTGAASSKSATAPRASMARLVLVHASSIGQDTAVGYTVEVLGVYH